MKYTIKRQISSGSFGTIYEILNEEDNKIYALKELTNKDIISKDRFEREVQTLSELDHPNIVKLFYWNVGGDPPMFVPYYIMECLAGNSLKEHADTYGLEGYQLREEQLIAHCTQIKLLV